jgi:hypothetical protein
MGQCVRNTKANFWSQSAHFSFCCFHVHYGQQVD